MNDTIKTMISQFCTNLNRLAAMIGARDFVYSNNANSLQFKFKMCKAAGVARLSYDCASDLYKMEFFKMKKFECITVASFEGLYCDMLKSTFEDFTGLRVSL
jgi:hypothetical protein